jgi:hypothetical protein
MTFNFADLAGPARLRRIDTCWVCLEPVGASRRPTQQGHAHPVCIGREPSEYLEEDEEQGRI